MTKEQREAVDNIKIFVKSIRSDLAEESEDNQELADALDTVLSLIKEQQEEIEKKDKQIDLIKEYTHQEIVHYTETIKDYEDDDKKENKHYIEELKEEREHWRDIEKILQNKPKEELYMNWWRYGLYE